MLYITKLVCDLLLPPGNFTLLLIVLTFWLYRRDRLAAKMMVIITLVIYLCSTPFLGGLLIRPLEKHYHPPLALEGDVLVMLTGGATLDTPDVDGLGHLSGASSSRLLTTARLQKTTNLPIIVSGGQLNTVSGNESQISKRFLISLGIPEDKIVIEDTGLNTTQSAQRTKEILEQKGYKKPILITSAFHMYRSVLNFKNIGVDVLPYPCNYTYNINSSTSFSLFYPSSFDSVRTALHEYLGILVISSTAFVSQYAYSDATEPPVCNRQVVLNKK